MDDRHAPPDLARWSLHCFCLGARSTPQRVARLDNNGRLLHSAVGGTTIGSLREQGLDVTESQLWLLSTYGLIELKGDQIETTFPMLGPRAVATVRSTAESTAWAVVDEAGRKAGEIGSTLAEFDLEGDGFAVVFGHALDGVIWDLLRQRGGVPDVSLDLLNPLWRGVFWALYPGRPGSAGTNELAGDGSALIMVWDEDSADGLRSLAATPGLGESLGTLQAGATRQVIPDVGPIPVVEEGGRLDNLSRDLAQVVVDQVPSPGQSKSIVEEAGVAASVEEATVIVAHEVVWALSELLIGSGALTAPVGGGVEGRLFVRLDT